MGKRHKHAKKGPKPVLVQKKPTSKKPLLLGLGVTFIAASISSFVWFSQNSQTVPAAKISAVPPSSPVPLSVDQDTSADTLEWRTVSKYIINDSTKKLISVQDVTNPEKSNQLDYSTTNFQLVGFNTQATLYFWKEINLSKDQVSTAKYILTNDQLEELETYEFTNIPGGNATFFDPVNNGVLFLKRFEDSTCTTAWHTVEFYDFTTLTLQEVLYSLKQPEPTCNSGCNTMQVVSDKVGTISLKTSCFRADQRFLDTDGVINITL